MRFSSFPVSLIFLIFHSILISSSSSSFQIRSNQTPEIDGDLLLMKRGENVTLIVTMRPHPLLGSQAKILESFEDTPFENRDERIQKVLETLRSYSGETQGDLLNLLNNRTRENGGAFEIFSMWITNQIIIDDADYSLLKELSNRSDIERIESDRIISFFPEVQVNNTSDMDMDITADLNSNSSKSNSVQWGIERVGAPDAWRKKITGSGITIAFIDSGVRGSHTSLSRNYRRRYGWFDPLGRTNFPTDTHGHGTHTAGTAVGSHGIGVAPGSEWIACRVVAGRSGITESVILKCGQFAACPSDPYRLKSCKGVPHIVSNSWGVNKERMSSLSKGARFFDDVIRVWRSMGIIPVFSIGNRGKFGCRSLQSPGDNARVISVGSTDYYDSISAISSVGPIDSQRSYFKPDFCAPGDRIYSASYQSDHRLRMDSGTSMSAPHLSGAIALMLSSNPKLTFDQIKSNLRKGCDRVRSSGRNCGGQNEQSYPNHVAGYGRINIVNSF